MHIPSTRRSGIPIPSSRSGIPIPSPSRAPLSPIPQGQSGAERVLSHGPGQGVSSGCDTDKNIAVCVHSWLGVGPGTALPSPRPGRDARPQPHLLLQAHRELRSLSFLPEQTGVFPVWGSMHRALGSFSSSPRGWDQRQGCCARH